MALGGWVAFGAGCLLLSGPVEGEEIKGSLGRSVAQVSSGGVNIYAPNKWGALQVYLTNPTDEPVELLVATYFEDEPSLQYGGRVWLPPRSRIRSWHPVLAPAVAANEGQRFNIRTLVMDTRHERDVLIRSDSGYLQFDGTLRAIGLTPVIGFIDTLSEQVDDDTEAPYELLSAMRAEEDVDRRISHLSQRMLPAGEEILQVLDQLVIADDRVIDDIAGLAAIRRWMFGGGHVWVMLDRVDPRVLELLLGDELICQVVDRVGLTTVRIEPAVGARNTERSNRDHEQPVELVRSVVLGGHVEFTVNGWPAAVTKSCGEGRILITMLGPQGWMRQRTSDDNAQPSASARPPGFGSRAQPPGAAVGPPAVGARPKPKFIPLEPMKNLTLAFFQPRPPPLLPESKLEPHVQEYVGYSVPPRWIVIGLLVGFSGLLAALGTWLWRLNRLELLGAIGPGLALAVSLVLVMIGRAQRQSIPAAVASVQVVQAVPGTDDVRVEGVAGVFSPEAGRGTIKATRGGWLMPDMAGLQGTTRRMVWTDLDVWQWENLPEAAGLRSARFVASQALPERLEAKATFGPNGLTGRLHAASARNPADILLATRDGRIGVDLRDDGTFAARSDNVFTAEQFLAAGLLSDEQNRRRRTLEDLLTHPERLDFPGEPQLLFWSNPWDLGFRFDEGRRTFGAALVSVPVQLERPPVGTDVALAPPLLPYRAVFGPDGLAPSGWWDDRRRAWVEKSWHSSTWLRFQIPSVLLPVSVQRGRIVVRVSGPVGKLEIAAVKQHTAVPLKSWVDPVGTLTLEITDPELLHVSDDGGLLVRVSGGDPERPELTASGTGRSTKVSYWQIESLTLDLHVKTISPATSSDDAAGGE